MLKRVMAKVPVLAKAAIVLALTTRETANLAYLG